MAIITQAAALAITLTEQAQTVNDLASAYVFNSVSGCISNSANAGASSVNIVTNTIGRAVYLRFKDVVTSPPSLLTITDGFDLTPPYQTFLTTVLTLLGYTVTSTQVHTMDELSLPIVITTINIQWQ